MTSRVRGSGTHVSVNSVGISSSSAWLSIGRPDHPQSVKRCGPSFFGVERDERGDQLREEVRDRLAQRAAANGWSAVIAASTPNSIARPRNSASSRPATPSPFDAGSASSTRSSWSKLSSSFGLAFERSSRLPRIVKRIEISCSDASGLPSKRWYGFGRKSGFASHPLRLPREHALGAPLRPPLEPRELGVAQELLQRRPPFRSRPEQVGGAAVERGHRLLALDREQVRALERDRRHDAEQPDARRHRVEEVGIGVVARELVDVAAPVDQPEPPQVAVGRELQRPAGRPGGGEPADGLMRHAAGVVQRPAASASRAAHSRLVSSVAVPVGSLGSAPRWMPASASTSLRASSLTRQPR